MNCICGIFQSGCLRLNFLNPSALPALFICLCLTACTGGDTLDGLVLAPTPGGPGRSNIHRIYDNNHNVIHQISFKSPPDIFELTTLSAQAAAIKPRRLRWNFNTRRIVAGPWG